MSAETDLRLEVTAGPAAGLAFTVDDRLEIGRQSDGHGRLGDDPELSRRHAAISRQADGTYSIDDLASSNGTLVNGAPISTPKPLSTRDSIEVGGTTIAVAFAPSPDEPGPAVDARAETAVVQTPPEMRVHAPTEPTVPEPTVAPPVPPPVPPEADPTEPVSAEAPAQTPRLELHLIVDPEAGEAQIRLDGETDPIHMSVSDGRWRVTDGGS